MQKIKRPTKRDAQRIYEISVEQFGNESWTLKQFYDSIENKNYVNYILIENEQSVAFLIAQNLIDSINLLLIATENNSKNKGFASALLEKLINFSNKKDLKIWLEVKEGNLQAINLYKKLDFKKLYERKNYYKDGKSALIFEKNQS